MSDSSENGDNSEGSGNFTDTKDKRHPSVGLDYDPPKRQGSSFIGSSPFNSSSSTLSSNYYRREIEGKVWKRAPRTGDKDSSQIKRMMSEMMRSSQNTWKVR